MKFIFRSLKCSQVLESGLLINLEMKRTELTGEGY